jgi:RNA polymerase sigma factor (sigma-70 family)
VAPTDSELIQDSAEEPEAFEEVFRRHFPAVLRYARRRIGQDMGEEVAAQTFLVAFDRRRSFNTSYASAKPWLLGIASNLIRHHVRDEATHLAAIARAPVDRSVSTPEEDERIDAERLHPLLIEALGSLRAGDRDAFLLFSLADLSYEEVSTALGIPIGTVRSRIHRVRGLLRERIGSEMAIEQEDDGRP